MTKPIDWIIEVTKINIASLLDELINEVYIKIHHQNIIESIVLSVNDYLCFDEYAKENLRINEAGMYNSGKLYRGIKIQVGANIKPLVCFKDWRHALVFQKYYLDAESLN